MQVGISPEIRPSRRVAAVFLLWLVPALRAERVPGHYIVELTTDSVAAHVATLRPTALTPRVRTPEAQSHRAAVLAQQQDVRSRVAARNANVLDAVNTVANALIVNVPDDAAAQQLTAIPGVRRVFPVRTVHLVLDRAVQLHKVPDAWNAVGMDK